MNDKYYFDTYALIELFLGNPSYAKFRNEVSIILNDLNLMELSYYLIRTNQEDKIAALIEEFSKHSVPFDIPLLVASTKMKVNFLKERLSFVDCIGYLLAKKHHAKFLTGDEKFRHKENVEFVN